MIKTVSWASQKARLMCSTVLIELVFHGNQQMRWRDGRRSMMSAAAATITLSVCILSIALREEDRNEDSAAVSFFALLRCPCQKMGLPFYVISIRGLSATGTLYCSYLSWHRILYLHHRNRLASLILYRLTNVGSRSKDDVPLTGTCKHTVCHG